MLKLPLNAKKEKYTPDQLAVISLEEVKKMITLQDPKAFDKKASSKKAKIKRVTKKPATKKKAS